MNAQDQGHQAASHCAAAPRAEGVGIAYHPFLHDALLAQADAFDFVELPLDLYVDPARSALLDPGDARLREIVAAKPCTWRGTILSLGSVEANADPALPPWLIGRIRQRLEQAAATSYTETIGFRSLAGRDIGQPQHLPRTEAAAQWIAARHRLASDALRLPILLQLPRPGDTAPPSPLGSTEFLARIAALSGCGLVLDTGDLETSPVDAAPDGRVVTASLSGTSEADWTRLESLTRHANPASIVLRRDRNLFPLDTIAAEAQRAGRLLAQRPSFNPSPAAPVPCAPDPAGLSSLHEYQASLIEQLCAPQPDMPPDPAHVPTANPHALATTVQSWRNWRMQIDDTHKTQQIADFLSRGAAAPSHSSWPTQGERT